jgi:hypothetical protein
MRSLKSLVATAAACFAVVLVGAGTAAAAPRAANAKTARPCWKQVINDWLPDARVDGTYPVRCYQQALRHLPPDLQAYSSAEQDFKRALLLAAAHNGGKPPSPNALIVGAAGSKENTLTSGTSHMRGAASYGSGQASTNAHHPGVFRRALDWLGPSNASSVPTPLLVLAGIALLLLLAGAASFVARWYQARRLRPAPHPAPPPHDR